MIDSLVHPLTQEVAEQKPKRILLPSWLCIEKDKYAVGKIEDLSAMADILVSLSVYDVLSPAHIKKLTEIAVTKALIGELDSDSQPINLIEAQKWYPTPIRSTNNPLIINCLITARRGNKVSAQCMITELDQILIDNSLEYVILGKPVGQFDLRNNFAGK